MCGIGALILLLLWQMTFNKAFNLGRVVHNSEVNNWLTQHRIAKVTASIYGSYRHIHVSN